jgi:hypothetical protein
VTEVDRSVGAEVGARRSGARVERDEPRVHWRDVDTPVARRVRGSRPIQPGRNAAIGEVSVTTREIELGVKRPKLLSRRRIERASSAERRRRVQDAVHVQRCRLVPRRPVAASEIAGPVRPDGNELPHVAAIDPGCG